MVSYRIGGIPLIKRLQVAYPDITQPRNYDYSYALGTFNNIGLYFESLKNFGAGRGYYTKPFKKILIVRPDYLAAGKEFGLRHGFKFCMDMRYLAGFIGDDESKNELLKYRTYKWEKHICAITKMKWKYPQESCVAVICAIQLEWIFFQRVKKYTGYAFTGVEEFLREKNLPCLFIGKSKYLPPIVGTLNTMMVKKSGLGLKEPVTSENEKYLSLLYESSKPIGSVTVERAFSTTNHRFGYQVRKS